MDNDRKILESAKRIKKKFEKTQSEADDSLTLLDEIDEHVKDVLDYDAPDIYTILDEERLDKWKKKKFTRWWRRTSKRLLSRETFYWLLLGVITFFLMTEALNFYAVDGTTTWKVYLKAALTEISFIFLSGYRAVGKIQTLFVGALRVSLFSLMLFVISSNILLSGASTRSDISNIASQIAIVESQIKEKQKSVDYYISINWPNNARIARQEKEKLVNKLIELKERQIKENKNEGVSDLVLYQTYGRAFFRVILLMISVLLTRRLFNF